MIRIIRTRYTHQLLAISVILLAVACTGSAEGKLTDQERKRIADAVGPVGDRVGFDIIIPSYLPKGISREVKADSHSDERENLATMVFLADQSDTREDGITSVIVIEERDPDSAVCPPCPSDKDEEYVKKTIGNHVVATKEIMTRAREVTHDIRFREGELHVIVQIAWDTESNAAELSDEMSREDFRSVESFFR